jgi:hypothetical protein
VIIFGYNHEERERKANVLKCKLRGLPKKYLGIPIFYKDYVVFTQKKSGVVAFSRPDLKKGST